MGYDERAAGIAGYPPNNRFSEQSRVLAQSTEMIRSQVLTRIVNDNQYELDRITKYYLYWKFYDGLHFKDFNDSMMSFNYVRAFIDKVNMFLLGDTAFSFHTKRYDTQIVNKDFEDVAEKFILYNWNKNNLATKGYELLQMGSVSGDVWAELWWDPNRKYVKINIPDSRVCYPLFEGGNYSKLASFIFRYPMEYDTESQPYRLDCVEYTANKIVKWKQKGASLRKNAADMFEVEETENPLGFIPVVHIKNKPYSPSYYSKSDAADILKINKIYNEMMMEEKAIIDYHATPTTVITGGSARNLKRSLGSIWSGLPPEANVFNLGLDVDLSAVDNFLNRIKTGMHELSDVPENALGRIQAISNTSGAALAITYQPLVQQADLKAITYGEGIAEINNMICDITGIFDPKNPYLAKMKTLMPDYEGQLQIDPVFKGGLPNDRQNDLNMGLAEIGGGIASKREVMERLGKDNIPDLQAEIDEDQVHTALIQAAINSALGEEPEEEEGGGSTTTKKPTKK